MTIVNKLSLLLAAGLLAVIGVVLWEASASASPGPASVPVFYQPVEPDLVKPVKPDMEDAKYQKVTSVPVTDGAGAMASSGELLALTGLSPAQRARYCPYQRGRNRLASTTRVRRLLPELAWHFQDGFTIGNEFPTVTSTYPPTSPTPALCLITGAADMTVRSSLLGALIAQRLQ